jgi:hypothetical protein
LIRAKFQDPGEVPGVAVELTISVAHADYSAIAFHVDKIVKKTSICGYLADRWSSMLLRPQVVIRALGQPIGSLAELRQLLNDELEMLDSFYRSKNNWMSVFVSGLLDPPVTDWLYTRLTSPGRAVDGRLI